MSLPYAHDLDSVVMLLVLHVQVHSRRVETGTFARSNNLGNVELGKEDLAMLHDLFGDVLGVQNAQLSKDSNMSIFQAKSLLEEGHEVGEVSKVGIVGNDFVDMVRVWLNVCVFPRKGLAHCVTTKIWGFYITAL